MTIRINTPKFCFYLNAETQSLLFIELCLNTETQTSFT